MLTQLRESFLDWDLYKRAIPDLLTTGLPNTLILTVCASVIGLLLGMVLAVAGISRSRWLRWPARIYTDIFRGGLPEVVIILLIGLGIGPVVGGITDNNPFPLGIAALGLMAAAYIGEIFRSGIQSVDAGQLEASRALGGFSYSSSMRLVVVPPKRPPGAARPGEPVHLAAQSVVAGVLPGSGGQPARAVPGGSRSQRTDRQPVAVGGGGPVLPVADHPVDALGQLHRRPVAPRPNAIRRGSAGAERNEPGDGVMASLPEPVSLACKDIHLAFGPPNKVLRGVNLDVPAGTTTAVIGPSGSGKSTLLRTLNRLYEPDRGDILLDGKSVLTDDPDALRQRIGMVFQQFNLFPHRSVVDNVALGPRKLKGGLSAGESRELALAQLDRVGLKHKAEVRPATLSGGQQQRGGDRAGAGDGAAGDVLRRGDFGARPRTGQRDPGADRRARLGRDDDGRGHP